MAQYHQCSKYPEHQSLDADYCSMCGAKIVGAASLLTPDAPPGVAAAAATAAASPSAATVCPDCGTPRAGSAKFCEICRYNYETGGASAPVAAPQPAAVHPIAPVVVPPDAPAAVTPLPADAPAPVTPSISQDDTITPLSDPPLPPQVSSGIGPWELIVTVDPSLYVEPDPNIPCPTNELERTFPIDLAENLIGRRSDRKDIHPEIPLTDPGVSHRHAKILRQADGAFVLLDVGSTNGTRLNGTPLAEGVRMALTEGDEITLGCWTRMRLQRVPR